MHRELVAALLIVVGVAAGAATASAEEPQRQRLVLVAPPAALIVAVQSALAPWHIEVVVIDASAPVPVDDAAAAAVADERDATAVAWLADGTLTVFARSSGHLELRPAPTAELDEAAAASLALSIKTLLRLPPVPPEEVAVVAPPVAPPPTIVAPPVVRPGPPRPPVLELEVAIAARSNGGGLEPRLGAGLGLRPPWPGPLQVALTLGLGPGTEATGADFRGTWHDVAVGAVARLPVAVAPGWRLIPGGGASLHLTSIDGDVASSGRAVSSAATNLGVDAELAVGWHRGPLGVLVRGGVTWTPWRQHYLASGDEVFQVAPVEAQVSLGLTFSR